MFTHLAGSVVGAVLGPEARWKQWIAFSILNFNKIYRHLEQRLGLRSDNFPVDH